MLKENVKINVLDELFECREENICTMTKHNKKKISKKQGYLSNVNR